MEVRSRGSHGSKRLPGGVWSWGCVPRGCTERGEAALGVSCGGRCARLRFGDCGEPGLRAGGRSAAPGNPEEPGRRERGAARGHPAGMRGGGRDAVTSARPPAGHGRLPSSPPVAVGGGGRAGRGGDLPSATTAHPPRTPGRPARGPAPAFPATRWSRPCDRGGAPAWLRPAALTHRAAPRRAAPGGEARARPGLARPGPAGEGGEGRAGGMSAAAGGEAAGAGRGAADPPLPAAGAGPLPRSTGSSPVPSPGSPGPEEVSGAAARGCPGAAGVPGAGGGVCE